MLIYSVVPIKSGRIFYILFLALLMSLLAGCSASTGGRIPFRDRSFDYQQVQTIPRLDISTQEGKRIIFDDLMPIPQQPQLGFKSTPQEPIPKPPLLIHLDEQAGLILARRGQQDWILVAQPTARVWEKLEQFWQQQKIPLEVSNKGMGIMETPWLRQHPFKSRLSFWGELFRRSSDLEKFRVQLTLDEVNKTAVLFSYAQVSPSHYKQDNKKWYHLAENDPVWQQRVEGQGVREQLVQAFSQMLIAQSNAVLVDGDYLKPQRITLTQDGNHYPVLELGQDFAPAWSNIGRALKNAHIAVDDLNRSLGIYYVRYDSDNKKPVTTYEIKVTHAEQDTHITVQMNDNKLAPVEVSASILSLIKQGLE